MRLGQRTHQFLRLVIPGPLGLAVSATGIGLLLRAPSSARELRIALVVAALAAGVATAFAAGALLRRVPARCARCGGSAWARKRKQPRLFRCADCWVEEPSDYEPKRTLEGLAFVAAGLAVTLVGIFGDVQAPRIVVVLLAQALVLPGLLLLGLGSVVRGWVARRHPAVAAWPWSEISGAGIACLCGLGFMLVGLLDPRDDAFPSGRPVVYVAGLVFFLAGVAILIPALARGRDISLAQRAVTATLLSAFAAVPVLIALGEGALPLFASIAVLGALALAAWDGVLKRLIPRRAVRLSLYAGLFLALAAVMRLGHDPGETRVETPVFEPVVLAVEGGLVTAGEAVRVTFDRPIAMPRGYGYWICIVPKGAEVYAWGRWTYLSPGATAVELPAPDAPGEYEVRLHPHLNAVISSVPLVVRPRATPEQRRDVEKR